MEQRVLRRKTADFCGGLTAAAMREPAAMLAALLVLHVLVWTIVPLLVCHNLQLDLAEDLALGKEWQLGYWKHPPLPWWIADLVYRLTGQVDSIYILGPLATAVCLFGVWLLGRELLGGFRALIAVIVLEGVHFYNFSAVKFAHDQLQLPFWAFTGLLMHRALTGGRPVHWLLAGALLAGAFWSKYAAFALAGTLAMVMLFDPFARRSWRTAGPYLMALAFAVVLAPNLWWLVQHDFAPFHYVDVRAKPATHWYQFITFPLQWTGSQILMLLPAIALLAILYFRAGSSPSPSSGERARFDRRFITALALGPFAVTTAVAILLGRLPVAMWGYPLWTFASLAALMWFDTAADPPRLRAFAAASLAVLVAFPVAYAAAELFEPFVRDRKKATQYSGEVLADMITRRWREATGMPLVYVGGADIPEAAGAGEFTANLVAVHSPDRPHVIVHGDPRLTPWIDADDLDRRGAVLIWEPTDANEALPANLQAIFPRAELQPPVFLPRQTLYPRSPVHISYAFVRPH